MRGIILLVLALLVGAGIFTLAYRVLRQLGEAPESDIGHYPDSTEDSGGEDAP